MAYSFVPKPTYYEALSTPCLWRKLEHVADNDVLAYAKLIAKINYKDYKRRFLIFDNGPNFIAKYAEMDRFSVQINFMMDKQKRLNFYSASPYITYPSPDTIHTSAAIISHNGTVLINAWLTITYRLLPNCTEADVTLIWPDQSKPFTAIVNISGRDRSLYEHAKWRGEATF